MEEIDIIELLQRVKEGKAPKKIEIDQTVLYRTEYDDMSSLYKSVKCNFSWDTFFRRVNLDTKIKILDKPVIEEIEIRESKENKERGEVVVYIDEEGKECENFYDFDMFLTNKINEIIRYLKEEK